jgi:hypothetical protein
MALREQATINEQVTPTGAVWSFGTAAPTAGAHGVGDTVFNTAPTAGGVFCWVCTEAGTPGTFKTVAIAA